MHRHTDTGAKMNFLSRNYQEFEVWKMWILWKMRLQKCEFCEKWDFRKVNFVKTGIFNLWIYGKNVDFCPTEIWRDFLEINLPAWKLWKAKTKATNPAIPPTRPKQANPKWIFKANFSTIVFFLMRFLSLLTWHFQETLLVELYERKSAKINEKRQK